MSTCACGKPATKFVTSDYAWGGDPAYGSYRAPLCDACADQAVETFIANGNKWAVQPLAIRRPADPTRTPESYRDAQPLGTYREQMIDAGRGRLLR